MPKISVIVPVYNVEKYLSDCLDSILKQTFTDIEIICVNDGSTDNSRKILEEYKNKDSRIRIVDKENGGLSSARNAGMKAATGEFYSFIDSDDWADITMLEKLYNNAVKNSSDIVICGVNQYDETNKQNIEGDYFTLKYFDKSFDDRVFSYEDTLSFTMNVCVMAWNKLYRKSFVDGLNAKFPEGLIFEDGPFFFSIYFKTKRVSIVRELLYNYRINRQGSIVQKGGQKFIDIIDVVELMYKAIKDEPCFKEIKNDFWITKAADILYRYELVGLLQKCKFSKKLRQKKFLFDPNIFDFDYISEKEHYIYKNMMEIKERSSIFNFYKYKFKRFWMYKIMQILYTEENIYYLKYRKLVVRLKKRANLYDIWYENDRIHVVLFSFIKMSFKFEYSKLERK